MIREDRSMWFIILLRLIFVFRLWGLDNGIWVILLEKKCVEYLI